MAVHLVKVITELEKKGLILYKLYLKKADLIFDFPHPKKEKEMTDLFYVTYKLMGKCKILEYFKIQIVNQLEHLKLSRRT